MDAVHAALAPYPVLRTLAAWHLALWWLLPTLFVRYSAVSIVAAAFCASMFAFGDAFGRTQLVGGYVLVVLYLVALPTVWAVGQVVLVRQLQPDRFPNWAAAARSRLTGSFWPWPRRKMIQGLLLSGYAIVPAWARCVRDDVQSETALGHVQGDAECTCAAPRCSGALLASAARNWVVDLAARTGLIAAVWVFLCWTPFFSLPQVWSHAWSISLGICYCGWSTASPPGD
ncbi:hypothetical protein DFJ74DRAFT_662967 [Hyaloraphidium curvatum]|nr:hypothetical protein DFJ74DRAFT_662967 [Hyaloraphidium curvatum]